MTMSDSRRTFLKSTAAIATASAAGITLPGTPAVAQAQTSDIRWDKAACRFCGTGCSVLIGTKDGRVVATVSKTFFSWTDTYGVDVEEGQDDVLLLCCAVVIDLCSHDD